jgi:hypothetical protein
LGKLKDLSGMKFGRLTVINLYKKQISEKNHHSSWACKCDCGNEDTVIVESYNLQSGNTKSCGCLQSERALEQCKENKRFNDYCLDGEYGIGYTLKGKKFYFDLEDFEKIKNFCWRLKEGYIATSYKDKTIRIHQLLLGYPDFEIDHKNRHRYDNRKQNLRQTTDLQNAQNKSLRKDNKSGFAGVRWIESSKKWHSRIRNKGKDIHLGYFINKLDAIITRLKAELEYFGIDFAPQRHLFAEYGII